MPPIRHMRHSRRAAAGMQYATILGLVAVIAIVAVTQMGSGVTQLMSGVGNRLCNAASAGCGGGSGSGGGSGGGSPPPPPPPPPTSGNLYGWGRNTYGELGMGSSGNLSVPTIVVGPGGSGQLQNVVQTASGIYSSCALNAAGNVFCWGDAPHGELGNNTSSSSLTPVQVWGPGGSGVLSGVGTLSAGQYDYCARVGGSVYCWGNGGNGQLGDGTTNNAQTPVQVLGIGGSGTLSGVTDLSGGYFFHCANRGGTAACWGLGNYGQLGNNTTSSTTSPVTVQDVGGGGSLSGITKIASGVNYSCAAKGGGVYCWGYNAEGNLGDNTTTARSTPVQVRGVGNVGTLSGISDVVVSNYDSCAIGGGNVWCWGINNYGQLGTNNTTSSLTPVQVLGPGGSGVLSGVTQLGMGLYGVCALVSGSVYCWGDNRFGQAGNGSTSTTGVWTPSPVVGPGGSGTLTGVIALTRNSPRSYFMHAIK